MFDFFSRKLAACLKLQSRDNHREKPYPRTQQCDQGVGQTEIMQSGSLRKRHLYTLFEHAGDMLAPYKVGSKSYCCI